MKANLSTTCPIIVPETNLYNYRNCSRNQQVRFAIKCGQVWTGCGQVLDRFLNLMDRLDRFSLHFFKKEEKRVNNNNIATIGETCPTCPTRPEVFADA